MTKKIKLLKLHKHRGLVFPEGVSIDVDDASAKWLVENKVGEQVSGDSAAPAAPSTSLPSPSITDTNKA